MEEKMKTIILKVNDDFHSNLKEKARASQRSMSQYIRDVIVTNEHPFLKPATDALNSRLEEEYARV